MKKSKVIEIENLKIGPEHPPVVIAEIGINHGGNISVAKEMIDAAARAGAKIVKHQTHIVDDEMTSEAKNVIPGNSEKSIYDIMDSCSLSEDDEFEMMQYAKSKGLIFISSPFSRAAAIRLNKFNVPAFKIGSGECNNFPLLELIASFNKPVILSTGMNTVDTVAKALKIFESRNVPVALLHTTNLYPTPSELVRLGALEDLMNSFPENIVGLSDHTLNNNACIAAVALGACLLERHFTDVMTRIGPDIICSMDEIACKELIISSEEVWKMRGGKKEAAKEEQVTIDFAFASVCTIKPIQKGELFTTDNLWVKRPGTGYFLAESYNEILGKRALRDVKSDVLLKKEDVKYD